MANSAIDLCQICDIAYGEERETFVDDVRDLLKDDVVNHIFSSYLDLVQRHPCNIVRNFATEIATDRKIKNSKLRAAQYGRRSVCKVDNDVLNDILIGLASSNIEMIKRGISKHINMQETSV